MKTVDKHTSGQNCWE